MNPSSTHLDEEWMKTGIHTMPKPLWRISESRAVVPVLALSFLSLVV
jgi:hypothetical protein